MKQFATQRLDIVQKLLWISCHFDKENYTWRLDMVSLSNCLKILSQNIYYKIFKTIQHIKTWYSSTFFLPDLFGTFCPKTYIRKYIKQFSTQNYIWRLAIVQNVLISRILISQDQNVSILFVNNIYIGNNRTF